MHIFNQIYTYTRNPKCIAALNFSGVNLSWNAILSNSDNVKCNTNKSKSLIAMAHRPKMLCWNSIRKFSVKERCRFGWLCVFVCMYIVLLSRLILCRMGFSSCCLSYWQSDLVRAAFEHSHTHTHSSFQLHISLHFYVGKHFLFRSGSRIYYEHQISYPNCWNYNNVLFVHLDCPCFCIVHFIWDFGQTNMRNDCSRWKRVRESRNIEITKQSK